MSNSGGNKSKKKAQSAAASMGSKDKKSRMLFQVGVAVVLIALIAVIGFNIASKKSDSETAAAGVTPAVVTEDGAIRIGAADAKVVVTVVEDFQCPACAQFESVSGDTLSELSADNTIAVDYQPIGLLDRMSSTNYSTRAANASFCVADSDKALWPAWHTAMFEQQPPEGGSGLPDDELITIAAAAGADSPEVASCITDGTYSGWIANQTKTVLEGGVQGTPTVSVNGTVVANPTPDELRTAITAAK